MPEAAAHPFVAATGIRAYAGVPVRRADGTLFGTLCCLSREPQPELGERDLRYLDVLARMAADRLAAAEGAHLHRRAEVEAAAGQALLAALNARENYTAAHSEAVLELALEVAAELGMGEDESTSVGQVALLHDIGKVGVPDAILRKPGRLTAPEWDVMREHPAIGAEIVGAIGSLSHLAPAVRAEHERWDGGGYPDGLAGEDVPLASRICLVCDAWHAMTSDRPYRRGAHARRRRARSCSATPARSSARRRSAALLRVLDRGGVPVVEEGQHVPLQEATLPRVRPDRPLEAELRALITVSSAVAGAHRFEEVLDAVGEQACKVLRAAGISISRWEPEHDRMRTLINAGELTPGDVERPAERDLDAHRARPRAGRARPAVRDRARARRRCPTRSARTSSASGAAPRSPRRSASRTACGACSRPTPTSARRRSRRRTCASPRRCAPRWRPRSGAPSCSRGWSRSPTRTRSRGCRTGARSTSGSRRRSRAASPRGASSALLFCDLDGLKDVNDRHGHDAGDRALIAAGQALAAAAEAFPGSFTSRLGGDEFCVLMEGYGAERRARWRATPRTGSPPRPAGRSRSPAASRASTTSTAARPTCSAPPTPRSTPPSGSAAASCSSPSRAIPTPAIPVARGVVAPALPRRRPARARGARALPARAARRRPRRRGRAGAAGGRHRRVRRGVRRREVGDLPPPPRRGARSRRVLGAERRDRYDPDAPDVRFSVEDEVYALADYPLTAAIMERGGGFAIDVEDESADARERALLTEWGFTAVTAAAALAPDGSAWLVELFSDRRTHALPAALPELRLLAGEAAGRGPAPGYAADVTSRANISNTST